MCFCLVDFFIFDITSFSFPNNKSNKFFHNDIKSTASPIPFNIGANFNTPGIIFNPILDKLIYIIIYTSILKN